jgi:hypothetical protein
MKGKFELVEEIQNDDGTWSLIFDVDDEFQEWFKAWQGLERWSHKRFQKVLHEALLSAVERETPMNKIMIKDDASKQNNDHYVTKVQEMPNGELFVELPQKLIDQLGWECGDEVKWEEIRDLDDMIIKSIEINKVIEYPEEE